MKEELEGMIDEIEVEMEVVLSDCDGDSSKYTSSIERMLAKIKGIISDPFIDAQKKIDELEGDLESAQDEAETAKNSLEANIQECGEAEENAEHLRLVRMFRECGGFAHDVTYGDRPLY